MALDRMAAGSHRAPRDPQGPRLVGWSAFGPGASLVGAISWWLREVVHEYPPNHAISHGGAAQAEVMNAATRFIWYDRQLSWSFSSARYNTWLLHSARNHVIRQCASCDCAWKVTVCEPSVFADERRLDRPERARRSPEYCSVRPATACCLSKRCHPRQSAGNPKRQLMAGEESRYTCYMTLCTLH